MLPRPPLQSAIPVTTQTVVTIVMGVLALGTLGFSLARWRTRGEPTFLALFFAGGMMTLMEPVVDTVGGCWMPRINSWRLFSAYGHGEPVWLCLAYFFYFGVGIGVLWEIIRRGVTTRTLWGLFAAGAIGDFLLEVILLHFHTYIYFGGQPLRVLRFPLWWAPVNSLIVLATAVIVARAPGYVAGRRALLIIPVALSTSAAVNALVGWPSWLVINSPMPWVPRQLGGILTFIIAGWCVSLLGRLLSPPAATSGESRASGVALEGREPELSRV